MDRRLNFLHEFPGFSLLPFFEQTSAEGAEFGLGNGCEMQARPAGLGIGELAKQTGCHTLNQNFNLTVATKTLSRVEMKQTRRSRLWRLHHRHGPLPAPPTPAGSWSPGRRILLVGFLAGTLDLIYAVVALGWRGRCPLVIPLSTCPFGTSYSPRHVLEGLLFHTLLVGIPIALMIRRHAVSKASPGLDGFLLARQPGHLRGPAVGYLEQIMRSANGPRQPVYWAEFVMPASIERCV